MDIYQENEELKNKNVKVMQDNLTLGCTIDYLKDYHDGYREYVLEHVFGGEYIEDVLEIDTMRYSPGSARQIAYSNGWKAAEKDIKNGKNTRNERN